MPPVATCHVEMLPTDHVKVHEKRRRKFDSTDEMTQAFVDSIRKVGVLQPIEVRKVAENFYEVVYGRRRLAAAKLLGMETIPCRISVWSEKEVEFVAVVENTLRGHLEATAHAKAIKVLLREYEKMFGMDPKKAVGGEARAASANRSKSGKFAENQEEPHLPEGSSPANELTSFAGDEAENETQEATPKAFSSMVSNDTGKTIRNAQFDIKVAEAFTVEQLDAMAESDISRADLLRIAAVEDKEDRDVIVKMVAAANLPVDEAIARVTSNKDHLSANIKETQKKIKEELKEEQLPDDQWLETYCKEIRDRLQCTRDFDRCAILYRRTGLARSELQSRGKKFVLEAKKEGWAPMINAMFGVMFMLHPGQWLICLDCCGMNVDDDECDGCKGFGFHWQWDRSKK